MILDHISYSAIKDWYICPYFFKLKHIEKLLKEKNNVFLAFGKTLHSIVELSEIILTTKNDWNIDQNQLVLALINNQFDKLFLSELKTVPTEVLVENKNLVQNMRNQGKNIIPLIGSSFKEYFHSDFEIVSTEEKLLEPIGSTNLIFKGFIDLILKTSDNKYHIIDFKTTSWGWDGRKKSDKIINYQITLYKIFWAQKHNIPLENIETHFVLLKRTGKKDQLVEPFRISSGNKKITNAIDFLKAPIKCIEKQYFPKKSTTNCSECLASKNGYCTYVPF